MRNLIMQEYSAVVGGNGPVTVTAPQNSGGTATAGNNTYATCPAGTTPFAFNGQINAGYGGFGISGGGGFATCIPG